MTSRQHWTSFVRRLFFVGCVLAMAGVATAKSPTPAPKSTIAPAANRGGAKSTVRQDDSFSSHPAKDLLLRKDGELKAEALAKYVEGKSYEENGEMEKALACYRQVLNYDPGQAELASQVAVRLSQQDDFPQAIDVLKDAVKANPKAVEPYLELARIYAKYLKKTDQAVEYANKAIALDPADIDAYQRLCEVYLASGNAKKALEPLDRAAKSQSTDPAFWTRLGKLYAALAFKPDVEPAPSDVSRINEFFKKAAGYANDDPAVLKEVADYYASSQQIREAIPLYLRVLELQPEDSNARENLAKGFVLTNQRDKAVEMLEEIIKQHPEKFQPYDLLAQVLEDEGRALVRENKTDAARAAFTKAAANYEQSLLINPVHATTYGRLAELLLGPIVKDPERAVRILKEARRRFPDAPEMAYYLAVALREAKHSQQAVQTFEEALHESELESGEVANARFYFDYGAAAEQAGLYDKAADLFKKSISLDPVNSAEACNYLGYMWAEQNSHLEEAADMIKRALQMDPNNGAYLDSMGWVEYRQGKFEDALRSLQRAAKNMSKDDSVVFEHLGDVYAQLKQVPQAVEAWGKAHNLDPKNKALADKIENAKTKISKGDSTSPNPYQ